MSIPISTGSGAASVAAEEVGGLQYQRVEILGQGGSSVMGVNPDRSINVSVIGAVQVTGSIVSVGNSSISGAVTVEGSVLLGSSNASVITVWQNSSVLAVPTGSVITVAQGSVAAALQSTNASVITVWQDSSVIARITGSVVAIPSGNQSVSGAITVSGSVLLGNSNASVITVGQGSVAVVIVSGSIAATVTPPANQSVSGAVTVAGSVLLGSSNASVITVWQNSSVISVVRSSVATAFAGNASVVQGVADLRVVQGGSVAALAAPGASTRYYVTGIQVANFGPSSVLVKISDNTTSTLGWTIAPAGGGSNFNPYYRTAINSPVTASINGTASVIVSMQGFTSGT